MATDKSEIAWTDSTWNPVRGCQRVSPGCEHCYAETAAHRFSGPGGPYEGLTKLTKRGPAWTGVVRFVPEQLDQPLRWKRPRKIFVNSMSDLFHEDVTNEQIAAVFGIMGAARSHTFQVLTKRADRMRKWFAMAGHQTLDWLVAHAWKQQPWLDRMPIARATNWPLPNVWLGVSAESQEWLAQRVPDLLQTPAAVRFVSAEPLLGPLDFTDVTHEGLGRNALRVDTQAQGKWPAERHLDWVIVGGESGAGARPCNVEWIESIVRQCREAGTPCFVKQLGARPIGEPRGSCRPKFMIDRKGGDPSEWPAALNVRQFPGG